MDVHAKMSVQPFCDIERMLIIALSEFEISWHTGTLIGSSLGPVIDSYNAIFRTDNSPTTPKRGDFAGTRTSYVVLNHDWAQVIPHILHHIFLTLK